MSNTKTVGASLLEMMRSADAAAAPSLPGAWGALTGRREATNTLKTPANEAGTSEEHQPSWADDLAAERAAAEKEADEASCRTDWQKARKRLEAIDEKQRIYDAGVRAGRGER